LSGFIFATFIHFCFAVSVTKHSWIFFIL